MVLVSSFKLARRRCRIRIFRCSPLEPLCHSRCCIFCVVFIQLVISLLFLIIDVFLDSTIVTFVVSITCVILSSAIRVRRPFNLSFLAKPHKYANIILPTTPEATPTENVIISSAVDPPSKDNNFSTGNNLSSTSPSQNSIEETLSVLPNKLFKLSKLSRSTSILMEIASELLFAVITLFLLFVLIQKNIDYFFNTL